jgi:hypothetical protein
LHWLTGGFSVAALLRVQIVTGSTPLAAASEAHRPMEPGSGPTAATPESPIAGSSSASSGAVAAVRRFLRERRRFWMVPIAVMLSVFAILFLIAQAARMGPVIRALF